MNAIYKNQKASVLDNAGDIVTIVINDSEAQIDVDYSDPDLIIDPTDDQWSNT